MQRPTAVLFIINPSWKQLKSPSLGEWINKLCYIHVTEYH